MTGPQQAMRDMSQSGLFAYRYLSQDSNLRVELIAIEDRLFLFNNGAGLLASPEHTNWYNIKD